MSLRIAAALIAALNLAGCARAATPEQPVLMLITGLPLVAGERFAVDAFGSPALTRLEQDFRVRPIGISDRASLGRGNLLLMAQPRAQPAEALVDLDRWVRAGGRVAILADPRLDWPSERPLGDALRPPSDFADTGLLAHWGLTLDAPAVAGAVARRLGNSTVMASSPGTLRRGAAGACAILNDGFVARCRIGKGTALIVADADFINGKGTNLDALAAALKALAQSR